jgi:hypothetical protein
MPMSARLLRPRASSAFHPDAQDWRNRVITNGGTVSGSTLLAVSNFCRSIDSAGLRSLLWRVNPFAGDNLSAALVPLYRAPSSSGAVQGNATDTNTNFVSGDYSPSSGLLGNGSTKALSTGLAANFRNGRHIGMVPHTLAASAFRYYMGSRNGGSPANGALWALYSGSPTTIIGQYTYSDSAGTVGDRAGTATARRLMLGNNLDGSGGNTLFSDGASVGSPSNGFDTTVTAPIGVFAVGQIAGTFSSHVNARLSGYTIGENMTAPQASAYNAIWTTLLTALGRS